MTATFKWSGWPALMVLACLVTYASTIPQGPQGSHHKLKLQDNALCMQPSAPSSPRALEALSNGQRGFTINLLRSLAGTFRGNLFVSPHSIYQALLLAYFTAAGQTEESVKHVLQLPPEMDKLSTMRAYSWEHKTQQIREQNATSYELRSANRLFVDKSQKVRECLRGLFDEDELQSVDFTADPVSARKLINSWVESITKGHIRNLIPVDGVHENTKLILANAAYFKGLWQSQFLPENTQPAVFFVSPSQQVLVDMMKQKGSFNFKSSERLGARVLELPYKGQVVSMYILLPPSVKNDGIPPNQAVSGVSEDVDGILKALTPEALKELVDDELMPQQVEVQIPKFKAEQTSDLVETLEGLGIGDLFRTSANLTSLTGQPGITFDSIVHKSKIEVDEAGTKAAGATAIVSFRSSRPLTPVQFICNHPFVYLLYDKQLGSVLFAGVYRTPKA